MKFYSFSSYAAILCCAAAFLGGCGGDKDAPANSGPLKKIDPTTAGTVSGTIRFEGTPPEPKVVAMDSDPACSRAAGGTPVYAEDAVIADGRLANAFVYISKGIEGQYEPTAQAALLDQKGCRYYPHVLGVMIDQEIQIRNSDSTLHNVHAAAKINKPFNLGQARYGKVDTKSFAKEELMIPIRCDVHGWMKSYVGVLPHPFFSVSGADGSFTLPGLPPGTYTVTAWHEKYGTQEQQVTVETGRSTQLGFTFKDL